MTTRRVHAREEVAGAQSIRRAAAVLRALAEGDRLGLRLSEVAARADLHKATAHRILGALAEERLVEQSPETKRYHLGLDAFLLGAKAALRFDICRIARPSLVRIAEATEDTVYLSVRSGLDALCVDRQEGAFPIKTLTLDIGSRRPLGVGSGSLALLASLPDAEVREVVARNAERLGAFPKFTGAVILDLVRHARAVGYAFNEGRIVGGMSAVAVPVLGEGGEPIAALSVAAIRARMGADRRREIVALLRGEAARLARSLRPGRAASATRR